MSESSDNPYVGPRPFKKDEAGLFFGREREARDLLSLVVSERLVLFYAQSGAGKTSLINTRLIPGLDKRGFEVLPVGRVSGDILPIDQVDNIFVANLATHLDQSGADPKRLARLTISQLLANINNEGHGFLFDDRQEVKTEPAIGEQTQVEIWPRALIIDQFEEIFTTHPESWEKRPAFFTQLCQAMEEDPYLWLILTIREDFLANLDPYAHLLPDKLRARYYMQRMGRDAALEAVQKPVQERRPFAPGVADKLVDNLRLLVVNQSGTGEKEFILGEFVEPVQLQVVCFQLWENLINSPGPEITQQDLDQMSKGEDLAQFVNRALAEFYEQAIAKVLQDPNARISERELREWFSTKLITESETRGFVYQGEERTEGLPNAAVQLLEKQFLIRGETRSAGKWYELVHDRFISPILESNREWRLAHQNPLTADAEAWQSSGNQASKLYDGTQLKTAQVEADAHPEQLSKLEKDFLRASVAADQRRKNQRQTFILLMAIVMVLGFATLSLIAVRNAMIANNNAAVAKFNADQARTNEARAVENGNQSRNNEATAQKERDGAIEQGRVNAESIVRLQTQISTGQVEISIQRNRVGTLEAFILAQYALLQPTTIGTPTQPAASRETPTPTPRPLPGSTNTPSPLLTQLPSFPILVQFTSDASTKTAQANPIKTFEFGRSVLSQPLEVISLGTGPHHITLVGGLHSGFAPGSVDLAKKIVSYYTQHIAEIPAHLTLDIVINNNPDSSFAPGKVNGRLNANQVDLNRNWDCSWVPDANWGRAQVSGGSAPFSEPESRALRDYILKTMPAAVVFWEARAPGGLVSPGGCGAQSLFSTQLSQLYGNAAGYSSAPFEAYAVTGDATNWLDAQGIPAISVLLPDYQDPDVDNNLKAVRALLQSINP